MNFIIIVSDTLRRDHLGCYGNKWISTPYIDRFASQSTVCDRYYTGSFPTVPHRTDLFTGRFTFTYRDWAPLGNQEVVLSQVLGEAGYTSMFIVDTPHLVRDAFGFDRGFTAWEWIRGQENDRYRNYPHQVEMPCDPQKLRETTRTVGQYLRNVAERTYESDYFAPMTMTRAAQWLEHNYKLDKFLLYVDTFDPHEPWDPPRYYVDMYDPGYEGEEVTYPIYGPATYLTEAELRHMRALYAAELTMVDRWVGRLLQTIEDTGLLDNTAIFFLTDHGFYLGEHGLTGKIVMLYEEVAHSPLIIRLPGQRQGARCPAFVQPADIMPTILDLAGVEVPPTVQGSSFVPVLKGEAEAIRDCAVTSYAITHPPVPGEPELDPENPYEWLKVARKLKPSTLTMDDWALICGAGDFEPELYNLKDDPGQKRNVFSEHREVAERLHRRYVELLEWLGTDEQYLGPRRQL